jgi:translocation and assembly module TamB
MIKRKLKTAFIAFAAVTLISGIGGVLYLQSEAFAQLVKKLISDRSPKKLGVIGDFKNLKLYFFPPGIGVAETTIAIQKNNVMKVPLDANINAREIRISFAPIQMLSGTLQVSEFKVVGGQVNAQVDASLLKTTQKKKTSKKLRWSDLFELQINGVVLEDTELNVELVSSQQVNSADAASVKLGVQNLEFKKEEVGNRQGFKSSGWVSNLNLKAPSSWGPIPIRRANQMRWELEGNDEGIRFSPLLLEIPGLNLKLNGRIQGNVLDETAQLSLDTEAQASTNLKMFFTEHFTRNDLAGRMEGTARLSGNPRKLDQTLQANVQLSGQDVSWNQMQVDFMELQGVLNLETQLATIKSLHLVHRNDQSDSGEVSIGETQIPLKLDRPFSAQLNLKNADLHWLGGAVIQHVYGLEGWLTGNVKTKFDPGTKQKWILRADTQLSVARFALTNQKWKVKRPKKWILRPSLPIQIQGPILVNSRGAVFEPMKVHMEQTQFQFSGDVTGGTYNLLAEGPVLLKEIDQISEAPIRGEGSLSLRVRGPSSHVLIDFDVDVKNAQYLDMNLGDLAGKITYDDGIYEIRLADFKATQRSTKYSLKSGLIDLDRTNEIKIPITVEQGRIEDVVYIMEKQMKNVTWYPPTLIGETHGQILVGGTTNTNGMVVVADLEGSDWTLHQERARKLKMKLGMDRGRYFAENIILTKTNGKVLGNVDYDTKTDYLKWNLFTENFQMNDIDFLDRLQVPVRGKIELKSSGQGKTTALQSITEGRLYETVLKGDAKPASSILIELNEKNFRFKSELFGDQVKAQIKYALTPKQPSQVLIDIHQFDFSSILLALNPKLLDDPQLVGIIDGEVHLDFLSTQAELARGTIALNEYRLKKTGASLELINPIQIPIQLGFFSFAPSKFKFNSSEWVASGEGSRGTIDVKINGKTDLSIAEFFSASISKIQGLADTAISISGPIKDLKVNGDLTFEELSAQMRWIQTPFEDVEGAIRIRQNKIYIDGIEGYLGDELFTFGGLIETFTDRFPKIDLKATLQDNKVKMAPLDLVQVRGSPWIRGEEPPYIIGGNLEVLQALWTQGFSNNTGIAVRGERFAPDVTASSNGLFVLDLNVVAAQGFLIRNEIMDAEFKGKGKLVGAPENTKILGEAQLVQGKILFRDRPFNLESVKVEFDDPLRMNPKFNSAAVSEVGPYKIRLLASGRSDRWRAEFSSTPYLPENEIYSLLTSGVTTSDVGRFRVRDRSYVNQGEAASLILHSMDFSQDVQRKTGLQFDVEEGYDRQSVSSIFRPQTLQDNVASPKLVVKRSLGRRINLSLGSTVGVGTEIVREANAEYKVTPAFSLLGVWNAFEGVNTQQTRTSYGLDFRINSKFK